MEEWLNIYTRSTPRTRRLITLQLRQALAKYKSDISMPPKTIPHNTLYYGDNLNILQDYIPSESIDLIYLDPPFNSSRSYNVLFKDESGKSSESQITAFDDTWHWGSAAENAYHQLMMDNPGKVDDVIAALRQFIGANQMMAYLVMMAARLVELHRVLKPTGSLYLHCDPTASHYLKVILDTLFGKVNFRNEIVWCYETAGKAKRNFSKKHDVILFYSKSDKWIFNSAAVSIPRKRGKHMHIGVNEEGREYEEKTDKKTGKVYRWFFDEGRLPFDYWTDIQFINREEAQRLGYPTQKPLALLERIILASSNPGDLVLDPFCGCGTAVAAAEKLGRRWIGIDITHLAISLIKYRIKDMFPSCQFDVIGEPTDLGAALQLAQDDRYQFQWWALSLVRARPVGAEPSSKTGKKGSDQGIDGVINFIDDNSNMPKRVIVQVKSGHVKSGDIRDLRGVVDREKAAIGIFITLESPSAPMISEAASVGFYESELWQQKYPKIQILTIEQLLGASHIQMPPSHQGTFAKAPKVTKKEGQQTKLDL